ncbi:hypothetical protein B0H67DRAFT_595749 [Lasiosphaeris hirsuta]|uniref:Uncharacterized protein n=1 Tax=Lasiosphaeris hirsuta TaxID=260670 RepID=A0AA39ZPR3_9PEZI|nr:hypothetical protein B0H67DRAFT_595749 [Lasiosphaeris hirsuta]
MKDMLLYICIIEDCSKPDILYIGRSYRMSHIRHDHFECWDCLLCSSPRAQPMIFLTVRDLREHIKCDHAESVSES